MDNIYYKIWDEAILDSEIIQETESEKCNNPGFDINLGCRDYDQSLLMYAVDYSREELVEYFFLTYPNIDVNHRSNYNYTALHFCNRVSILRLLLDRRDLDVNIQNDRGDTGLHWVCYWGRETCVKDYLLDARINTSICNKYGYTARDIALRFEYSGIVKIINNSRHTTLLRIPNKALLYDIVRMIIEEYV